MDELSWSIHLKTVAVVKRVNIEVSLQVGTYNNWQCKMKETIAVSNNIPAPESVMWFTIYVVGT
jgi:hypothetical protein